MNNFMKHDMYKKTEPEKAEVPHPRNCCCTLCGNRYDNIAFKGGYVCETCVGYIKGLV